MPNLCQLFQSYFAPAQAPDVTLAPASHTALVADLSELQSVSSPATSHIEQHLAYKICLGMTDGLTSSPDCWKSWLNRALQKHSQFWHALL